MMIMSYAPGRDGGRICKMEARLFLMPCLYTGGWMLEGLGYGLVVIHPWRFLRFLGRDLRGRGPIFDGGRISVI